VGKETSQVPELGLLEPMDLLVLHFEQLHVLLLIQFKELAVALTDVPVVGKICAVLHAALDHHVAEFDLLSRSYLQL